jgi:Xaa-His dipeptidase
VHRLHVLPQEVIFIGRDLSRPFFYGLLFRIVVEYVYPKNEGAFMMEAIKLAGLEPKAVFTYFEQLCSVPHGSGNTKQISDLIVDFAKKHNVRYVQDELNNVLMFADATPGYEDHEPVIIQGHMDMVCEKDDDCPIDMEKEGLDITHDGKWVFANGTTLGGDDCIAVAYAMAILADPTIPHPPLEVIITVDEETAYYIYAGVLDPMEDPQILAAIDALKGK